MSAQDWEHVGIISEGDRTWIHPNVLARKKSVDGDPGPPKYRACLELTHPTIRSWLWKFILYPIYIL